MPTIEASVKTTKTNDTKTEKLRVVLLERSKLLLNQLVNEIIKQIPTTNISPPNIIASKINQLEGAIS